MRTGSRDVLEFALHILYAAMNVICSCHKPQQLVRTLILTADSTLFSRNKRGELADYSLCIQHADLNRSVICGVEIQGRMNAYRD